MSDNMATSVMKKLVFLAVANLISVNQRTILPLSIPTPQKIVKPKENRHDIVFSFGITIFLGGGINRGNTVGYWPFIPYFHF